MDNLKQVINENNYRDDLRLANKLRYANDPEMKKKISESKAKYERNRRATDPEYKKHLCERQKKYYKDHEEYREQQKALARKKYAKKAKAKTREKKTIGRIRIE